MKTPRALSANIPARGDQSSPTFRSVSSARTLPKEPTQNASESSDTSHNASNKPDAPHPAWEETKMSHNASPKTEVRKNALIKSSALSEVTGPNQTGRNPLEIASYILVFAKQGKSRHTGIWNAKTLVESCCNLLEIDPERLEDGDNYNFPEKGIAEELCGKIVVLHTRK